MGVDADAGEGEKKIKKFIAFLWSSTSHGSGGKRKFHKCHPVPVKCACTRLACFWVCICVCRSVGSLHKIPLWEGEVHWPSKRSQSVAVCIYCFGHSFPGVMQHLAECSFTHPLLLSCLPLSHMHVLLFSFPYYAFT